MEVDEAQEYSWSEAPNAPPTHRMAGHLGSTAMPTGRPLTLESCIANMHVCIARWVTSAGSVSKHKQPAHMPGTPDPTLLPVVYLNCTASKGAWFRVAMLAGPLGRRPSEQCRLICSMG